MEIQENSFRLAVKNAQYNGLGGRLYFYHEDVCAIGEKMAGSFHAVTANPPYTAGNRGIESRNRARAIARHETTASLDDFIMTAAKLLCDRGDFFLQLSQISTILAGL